MRKIPSRTAAQPCAGDRLPGAVPGDGRRRLRRAQGQGQDEGPGDRRPGDREAGARAERGQRRQCRQARRNPPGGCSDSARAARSRRRPSSTRPAPGHELHERPRVQLLPAGEPEQLGSGRAVGTGAVLRQVRGQLRARTHRGPRSSPTWPATGWSRTTWPTPRPCPVRTCSRWWCGTAPGTWWTTGRSRCSPSRDSGRGARSAGRPAGRAHRRSGGTSGAAETLGAPGAGRAVAEQVGVGSTGVPK